MRYAHTNIVARDWRRLARFYEDAFDCEPVPPTRTLSGEWLARGTGVPSASLRGAHLRLPGTEATLEVFEYAEALERPEPAPNRLGYGHLAFAVDDVEVAVERVVRHGGRRLGEVVTRDVEGAGKLTFTYVRDPEGNVIELQRWDG